MVEPLNPSLEVPFYGVPFYFNPFTPKQEYGHKSSTKIQISVQVNTCIISIVPSLWFLSRYTMMARLIRALELHYPMIQFLINKYSPVILEADPYQIPTKAFSSKICQNWWVIEHIKRPQKSEHGNMMKFSKTLRSSFHITWKRGWNRKCSFTSLVFLWHK